MMVVAIFLMVASAASAALPNQRTDLKVLLLAATGTEPSTSAWEAALKREGVPFEKKIATQDEPYTASTFADTVNGAPRAKYQAVIVATGGLVYEDNGSYPSALSTEEWAALADFEVKYGIRQITGFVYPSAEYGLNTPTVSGELGGVTGKLTAAGLSTFPYLKGNVPIDQYTWGYQATPATGAKFKTLLTGPGNSALVGINTRADGREEMVSTFDSNQYQLQNQLLRHGMLTWVTRGVYLGTERNYLTMHVDDVFLSSDRWDPNTHAEDTVKTIRMTANEVYRTALWSAVNGFRLDMLFNASGSDAAGRNDALTRAFILAKGSFGWINHTYSGEPNYDTTVEHIVTDIQKNISWARARGISIDSTDLVFDQHSGQSNPNTPDALTKTGVKWLGDDNSRFPQQRPIGPALTVPRYPSNIYYNTSTRAEQIDEYNYLYLPPELGGVCQNSSTTTCFTKPATWAEYVDREASQILRHALGNDPRPHYVHQANLAKDAILLQVMDEVLKRYRSYYKTAIVQPMQREAGQIIQTQNLWDAASPQVEAYLQNGRMTLKSTASSTLQVPVAGAASGVGSAYGGLTSGWTSLAPGTTKQFTAKLLP
jgi:hypothetical protein